ncbi:hypothetical protein [Streptomyces sp. NPDC001070]
MVSAAHTTEDLQVTAGALQGELQRLEMQKQALERELAAVVAHLGSVRRALGALSHLKLTAPLAAAAGVREEDRQPPAAAGEEAEHTADDAEAPERTSAEPAGHPATPRRNRTADDSGGLSAAGNYGRLTEQILEYLATTGGAEVRARDVASALGRDESAGSINAVRSTLDRLVGASRVRRAGRGLYRAAV